MEVVFKSLEELYKRIQPALKTKRREMNNNGYPYIKEEDIWNYLKEKTWKNGENLTLYEMVRDILNTEEIIIDDYLKEKLNKQNRTIYFEGGKENEIFEETYN